MSEDTLDLRMNDDGEFEVVNEPKLTLTSDDFDNYNLDIVNEQNSIENTIELLKHVTESLENYLEENINEQENK